MTDTVIVPREPTEEMMLAGERALDKAEIDEEAYTVYKAMLAAAPPVPAGDVREAMQAIYDLASDVTIPPAERLQKIDHLSCSALSLKPVGRSSEDSQEALTHKP